MRKQAKDLTEEERQWHYESHRKRSGIETDSDVVAKESIAKFCDNFIKIMKLRLEDKMENHIRAEEQLKAYTFVKNVLVGNKKGKDALRS